jgi:hypothetical protein
MPPGKENKTAKENSTILALSIFLDPGGGP